MRNIQVKPGTDVTIYSVALVFQSPTGDNFVSTVPHYVEGDNPLTEEEVVTWAVEQVVKAYPDKKDWKLAAKAVAHRVLTFGIWR